VNKDAFTSFVRESAAATTSLHCSCPRRRPRSSESVGTIDLSSMDARTGAGVYDYNVADP
jgi:hypothetical protein